MKKIDDVHIIAWNPKAKNCTNEPYDLGMTIAEYKKHIGVNVTLSDEQIAKNQSRKSRITKGWKVSREDKKWQKKNDLE